MELILPLVACTKFTSFISYITGEDGKQLIKVVKWGVELSAAIHDK